MQPINNLVEVIEAIDDISKKLQSLSDRAYLLAAKEGSMGYLSTMLRSDVILPLKSVLASAENLEERMSLPVKP